MRVYSNCPNGFWKALFAWAMADTTSLPGARQAHPFRAGNDSEDGVAVLGFGFQCGVCCC